MLFIGSKSNDQTSPVLTSTPTRPVKTTGEKCFTSVEFPFRYIFDSVRTKQKESIEKLTFPISKTVSLFCGFAFTQLFFHRNVTLAVMCNLVIGDGCNRRLFIVVARLRSVEPRKGKTLCGSQLSLLFIMFVFLFGVIIVLTFRCILHTSSVLTFRCIHHTPPQQDSYLVVENLF